MKADQRIIAEIDSLLSSVSQLFITGTEDKVTITLKDFPGQWHYADTWIDPVTKEIQYAEVTPEEAARNVLASALIAVIEQRSNPVKIETPPLVISP